ncbi:profilin-4 isoform X2 [Peromyscus californicus insignis]|uniref:profilin-4 isoform X2 n=1 Tax=Peromyscus californicus insignis TaxID=564181 RepID=UPI0022A6DE9E|nr:profilin-4 isoform X2 [Peromyscus californicus insignis]
MRAPARSDADGVRAQGRPAVRGLDPLWRRAGLSALPAPQGARGPSSNPCVASERADVRGSVSWTRPRPGMEKGGAGDVEPRGPPAGAGGRPRSHRQLSQPISFRACLPTPPPGSAHGPAPGGAWMLPLPWYPVCSSRAPPGFLGPVRLPARPSRRQSLLRRTQGEPPRGERAPVAVGSMRAVQGGGSRAGNGALRGHQGF